MRNIINMSHSLCKDLIKKYKLHDKNRVCSDLLKEADIQRDFNEVWLNIEESIRIYELSCDKKTL